MRAVITKVVVVGLLMAIGYPAKARNNSIADEKKNNVCAIEFSVVVGPEMHQPYECTCVIYAHSESRRVRVNSASAKVAQPLSEAEIRGVEQWANKNGEIDHLAIAACKQAMMKDCQNIVDTSPLCLSPQNISVQKVKPANQEEKLPEQHFIRTKSGN